MTFFIFRFIILCLLFLLCLIIGWRIDMSFFEMIEFVRSYEMYAPLIFIVLYLIVTGIFLPSTPLTIISGILFGPFMGTVYVVIAATIGGSLSFLLARYLGEQFVHTFVKEKVKAIQMYEEKIMTRGFLWVFILRLIPAFPFNALNLGLGLTKIRFKDFFLATFIGTIPGTFVYTFLGDSVLQLSMNNIIFAVFLLICFIIVSLFYAHKYLHKEETSRSSHT